MGNLISSDSELTNSEGDQSPRSQRLSSRHYHKIYIHLITGCTSPDDCHDPHHRRPPLPVELALYIIRLAECTVSFLIRTDSPFDVTSNGPLKRELWFTSPPLGRSLLKNIASITLVTNSRHQGWVSRPNEGSWSWWEVGVVRGSSKEVVEKEGRLLTAADNEICPYTDNTQEDTHPATTLRSFISHHHDVGTRGDRVFTGRHYPRDHELFRGYDPHSTDTSENRVDVAEDGGPLQVGDRISVFGCAQYPGWACHGSIGELWVDVYWEPEEVRKADQDTAEQADVMVRSEQ